MADEFFGGGAADKLCLSGMVNHKIQVLDAALR